MLIADAMTPEPMRPGWPESLRFAMLRLPIQRTLSVDERFAAAAARPAIYPELIIIDHGKAFASDAVKDACRIRGLSTGPEPVPGADAGRVAGHQPRRGGHRQPHLQR